MSSLLRFTVLSIHSIPLPFPKYALARGHFCQDTWGDPESHFLVTFAGKKKAYTALLQRRTFLCRKKWGPQRKDFGGRYGFPGFHRVFVSTTGLESFSFRPEEFPKFQRI